MRSTRLTPDAKTTLFQICGGSPKMIALNFHAVFLDRAPRAACRFEPAEQFREIVSLGGQPADHRHDFAAFAFLNPQLGGLLLRRNPRRWRRSALTIIFQLATTLAARRTVKGGSGEKACHVERMAGRRGGSVDVTLPLGASSVSEERVPVWTSPAATVSDPPASGRVNCH